MTDITTRLRRLYIDTGINYVQEAADEIEILRQRAKDANHGAERNAIINRELARELAALKQEQSEPVACIEPVGNGKVEALARFIECKGDKEPDPLERLRFFCSLAMKGQDWIDVEPFFDALKQGQGEPVGVVQPSGNDNWLDKVPAGTMLYTSAPTIQEGWQPIETAPKDLPCLVVSEFGNVWMAKYAYIGPRAGERWESIGLGRLPFNPTHWMNLPAAPKGETA